ncbi:MAG: tetratricopeptide repeat protein [Armatimonadetes bacterium]|nr:tetratricopeptide repeat protein [Armatimonadota bacterium]
MNSPTPSSPLPEIEQLWNYNRPAETEQRFRKLLPDAEAAGNQPYRLEVLTQIARCEGLQRRFADAHDTLDTVEPFLADAPPRSRLRYLLERGRVFNSSGNPAEARPLFVQAWEEGTLSGEDDLAVDAAHMVAIVEQGETALGWNEKAYQLAQQSNNPTARRWIGSLTNNIGWTWHTMGDYHQALHYFQQNVEWHTEMGSSEGLLIAQWCVARTLRSLGRTEEALAMQQQLQHDRSERGLAPDGYVFEELGECLLALDRSDEAREYFAGAYQLLSEDSWMLANEGARLQRLQQLGEGQ